MLKHSGSLAQCPGIRSAPVQLVHPVKIISTPRAPVVARPSSSYYVQSHVQGTLRAKLVSATSRDGGGVGGSGRDGSLDGYTEVKVDSVRVSQGASVVYLKLVGGDQMLPVHIGEAESSALLKELNKTKAMRPLTHDFAKTLLQAAGLRVTKIRITELVASTYFSRVHIARCVNNSVENEVDVDARPSDAINLAMRFGAPMYVSKKIAEMATVHSPDPYSSHTSTDAHGSLAESHADIVRSVRETLSKFEDPTVMYQLQKSMAIEEQRYEDAAGFQQRIYHEMTHNQTLRLVVAMEAALADGRFEEAARLRDEYRKLVTVVAADKKRVLP